MELNSRLRTGVRTQPPEEIAKAFVEFFKSKRQQSRPLEDLQAQHALATFEHLQKIARDGEGDFLSSEEIRLALSGLTFMSKHYKTHVQLARALFAELQKRWETSASQEDGDQERRGQQSKSLMSYLAVLSQSGSTLHARELVELHWENCLKDYRASPWPIILRGFMREKNPDELQKTVDIMQKYSIPFDQKAHQVITTYFAAQEEDMEMTKNWYGHPIASGKSPTVHTDIEVLKLCIKRNELNWGDKIFKSLLDRDKEDLAAWKMIFQWAAAKGKGVDEIEHMMQVMVDRSRESGKELRPDVSIINSLIWLANSKDDPYTAERYLALGQRWDVQPDANTYMLQLDYRLKVGDIGGARTAYARLQGEEIRDQEDLPFVSKLIVALCDQKPQNYDAIMGLVEDLSERNVRFEPETVIALSRLHLQREEMDDLVDLLNTHVFHFGFDQRASIRNVLLDHCLHYKTTDSRAWDTYNILRRVFSETDVPTRTKLMQNFFQRGRSDMATHVFGHMRQQQDKSLRPTVSTYAQCLSGLGQASDLPSLEIVHNMIKLDNQIEPDTQLYNALMLGYSGCGEGERALGFWQDIMHSREGPSYASIQIALRSCESAPFGDKDARDIWSKLQRFEVEVTREIYAAYVGALARHRLFDECVSLIDNAQKDLGYKADALLIGTFYNASPGLDNKANVKEWAWKSYPEAYEDLLKLGQYERVKLNEEGEEEESFGPRERFFNIGPIGRDAKA
ncbi:hypothetical protein ACLMJK_008132 [Lecanora helva]